VYGYRVSGLEGFARTAPLLGAWIYSGRGRQVTDPQTGAVVDLVATLRSAIVAGTDPSAPAYWGKIDDDSQRIVEAADIARLLWLTRREIWSELDSGEKSRVYAWLAQVDHVKISSTNNWLLFPVVVDAFLRSVGYPADASRANYEAFKKNLLQNGWFRDGDRGRVDYYNAWGISYDLYWIDLLDPSFERPFIEQTLAESGALTALLLSPSGIPTMGRSVCYRTAIPSAVLTGSFVSPATLSPGLARRALDATWRYFVFHGALREGALTMGYFETDARIVDLYSGAGSCHWGLRSLTLAFMARESDEFWTAPSEPLPVEKSDYRIEFPKLDWTVTGNRASGEITIAIGQNRDRTVAPESYALLQRAMEWLGHSPIRPSNDALKYQLHEYSALRPFQNLLFGEERGSFAGAMAAGSFQGGVRATPH
jgi:hypothetical protein